jgi:hypothetical protein
MNSLQGKSPRSESISPVGTSPEIYKMHTVSRSVVAEHKADHRVRTLPAKSQFLALLSGRLSGAVSLREIEAGLASQQARLYHVGGRGIARSTLAEVNARQPVAVFAGLFADMAATASRRTRRHISDAVRILDAIAHLLLRMAQACQDAIKQPLALTRLVRLDLMHKRPIDHLGKPEPNPDINHDQMLLIGPHGLTGRKWA